LIHFFNEDVDFSLSSETSITRWISSTIKKEGQNLAELNFVFCSDKYLLQLNTTYLNHDYYTDILTFDHRENTTEPVSGDIFISIDRVRENSITNRVTFENELHRVIIHGVLHLLGYSDHSPEERISMRKKEDACLSLLK
jgi:rRNA maturation RNase YbeY